MMAGVLPLCIRLSGGRSSAMMLHGLLARGEFLPERGDKVIFSNTGLEANETLDFVQECGDRFGVSIHWLEYRLKNRAEVWEAEAGLQALEGEVGSERYRALWRCRSGKVVSEGFRYGDESDPLAPAAAVLQLQNEAMGKGGMAEVDYASASRAGEPMRDLLLSGNCGIGMMVTKRICTNVLKIDPTTKFMRECGMEESVRVVGFRFDEPRRVATAKDRGDDFRAPLYEWGVGREEVAAFWKKMPFDLRLPSLNGRSQHGNCMLCPLKSKKKIAALMAECPTRAGRWIKFEELMARRRNRFGCRMWLTRLDGAGNVAKDTGWTLRKGGDKKVDSDWRHDGRIYRPTFLQGISYEAIKIAADSGEFRKWKGDDLSARSFWSDIEHAAPPCECGD